MARAPDSPAPLSRRGRGRDDARPAADVAVTIVQKYGGSSLATSARLQRVARAVVRRQREGARLVIVVSAMGRTTDALIARARRLTATPPLRELDMLVTAGERISMALLSMAIAAAGAPAVSFTGSQSGIITEPRHQGARILAVRPERIAAALAAGQVAIVAGYQGVSREREITTLGRGGSDTTAVALAAALGAAACEIYSDVDGVYTADPRVCPQARHLAAVSSTAMEAMARAGARVLHAEAVAFAARAGITIEARRTGQVGGRRTVIGPLAGAPAAQTVAVVGAREQLYVRRGPAALPAGTLAGIEAGGGALRSAGPGGTLVDCVGVPGGAAAAQAMGAGAGLEQVATASIIGGAAALALTAGAAALARAGIHVIAAVAAPGTVSFVVRPAAVDAAVRVLHRG